MKTSSFLSLRLAFAATLLALTGLSAWAEPAIGQPAPNFSLPNASGQSTSLNAYKGKFVVLEWTNYQCPFVHKHYGSGNMQRLQQEYTGKGVIWLSIISSTPGKQGYLTPDTVAAAAEKQGVHSTALLTDSDGTVGHLYGAKTTPDLFIINPQGTLIYAGAIDDKPSTDPADIATAHNYAKAALDEALAGKPVSVSLTKSYGCSVKY